MLLTEQVRDIAEEENLIDDPTEYTRDADTWGTLHDYGQIALSQDSLIVFRYTWKVEDIHQWDIESANHRLVFDDGNTPIYAAGYPLTPDATETEKSETVMGLIYLAAGTYTAKVESISDDDNGDTGTSTTSGATAKVSDFQLGKVSFPDLYAEVLGIYGSQISKTPPSRTLAIGDIQKAVLLVQVVANTSIPTYTWQTPDIPETQEGDICPYASIGHECYKACDGDTGTYWQSSSPGKFIYFDLGAVKDINGLELYQPGTDNNFGSNDGFIVWVKDDWSDSWERVCKCHSGLDYGGWVEWSIHCRGRYIKLDSQNNGSALDQIYETQFNTASVRGSQFENVGENLTNGVRLKVDGSQMNWTTRKNDYELGIRDALYGAALGHYRTALEVDQTHTITVETDNANTEVHISVVICPWILIDSDFEPLSLDFPIGSTVYVNLEPLFANPADKEVLIGKKHAISFGDLSDYYSSATGADILEHSYTFEIVEPAVNVKVKGYGACVSMVGVDVR